MPLYKTVRKKASLPGSIMKKAREVVNHELGRNVNVTKTQVKERHTLVVVRSRMDATSVKEIFG